MDTESHKLSGWNINRSGHVCCLCVEFSPVLWPLHPEIIISNNNCHTTTLHPPDYFNIMTKLLGEKYSFETFHRKIVLQLRLNQSPSHFSTEPITVIFLDAHCFKELSHYSQL